MNNIHISRSTKKATEKEVRRIKKQHGFLIDLVPRTEEDKLIIDKNRNQKCFIEACAKRGYRI